MKLNRRDRMIQCRYDWGYRKQGRFR